MDEHNLILEVIWNSMPEEGEWASTIYPPHGDRTESELYITDPDGQCWQITATRHKHAKDKN